MARLATPYPLRPRWRRRRGYCRRLQLAVEQAGGGCEAVAPESSTAFQTTPRATRALASCRTRAAVAVALGSCPSALQQEAGRRAVQPDYNPSPIKCRRRSRSGRDNSHSNKLSSGATHYVRASPRRCRASCSSRGVDAAAEGGGGAERRPERARRPRHAARPRRLRRGAPRAVAEDAGRGEVRAPRTCRASRSSSSSASSSS